MLGGLKLADPESAQNPEALQKHNPDQLTFSMRCCPWTQRGPGCVCCGVLQCSRQTSHYRRTVGHTLWSHEPLTVFTRYRTVPQWAKNMSRSPPHEIQISVLRRSSNDAGSPAQHNSARTTAFDQTQKTELPTTGLERLHWREEKMKMSTTRTDTTVPNDDDDDILHRQGGVQSQLFFVTSPFSLHQLMWILAHSALPPTQAVPSRSLLGSSRVFASSGRHSWPALLRFSRESFCPGGRKDFRSRQSGSSKKSKCRSHCHRVTTDIEVTMA